MSEAETAKPDVGAVLACVNCRFWLALGEGSRQKGGLCRRLPPQPILLGIVQETQRPVVTTYWPETANDMWCGEHRLPGAAPVDFSRLDTTEGRA